MNSKKAGLYYLIISMLSIGASIGISLGSSFFEVSFEISALITSLILLVPGIVMLLRYEKNSGELLQLGPVNPINFLLLPIFTVLTYPLIVLSNLISLFFTNDAVLEASESIVTEPFFKMFLLIGVIGPVVEELVFRGIIFGSLKKSGNTRAAIILQAFCFGLMHLNLNQFCYAFVFGIVLGFVVEATGSIISSIYMHGMLNCMGVFHLYGERSMLQESDAMTAVADPSLLYEGLYLLTFIAIITTGLAFLLISKIAKLQGREGWYKNLVSKQQTQSVWSVSMIAAIVVCVLFIALEVLLEHAMPV